MERILVSSHPLCATWLTILRDASTPPAMFRQAMCQVSRILACDATQDLKLVPHDVVTPLAKTRGHQLKDRIGLFPVLRAGLGMQDAFLECIPDAVVKHLGFFRDERSAEPVAYYSKLHGASTVDVGFILDPMLATGGTAVDAVSEVKKWGVSRVMYVGVIGAPEGVDRLKSAHPDVKILLAALDRELNEQKFIVPGLGDAGDRQYST